MTSTVNTDIFPLIGHSITELENLAESFDEEPFRGRQIFDWLYRRQVDHTSDMMDLPESFRKKLRRFTIHPLKTINQDISSSRQTKKFLFQLSDGEFVESVLMYEGDRITVCLSTQVGCAVDCDFCATAKMGFIKNLTIGEIVDQYIHLQKMSDEKITNVVFMGMGEPFLNYRNAIAAADLLHHPKGINLGAWRITISTTGIIPKIYQFTDEKQPYKLAISLNGSTHNQRLKTMPITQKHTLNDLLDSAKNYTMQSKKPVTFEYVLMDGINDDPLDSSRLKNLISSIQCKLNVIPYNEIGGKYKRSRDNKIETFLRSLKDAPFPVTVRWSKGTNIDAGCGQLATSTKTTNEKFG